MPVITTQLLAITKASLTVTVTTQVKTTVNVLISREHVVQIPKIQISTMIQIVALAPAVHLMCRYKILGTKIVTKMPIFVNFNHSSVNFRTQI